jgi:hypothetical protein
LEVHPLRLQLINNLPFIKEVLGFEVLMAVIMKIAAFWA